MECVIAIGFVTTVLRDRHPSRESYLLARISPARRITSVEY